MKASDIIEALRSRHPPREWAFITELRAGTGYRAHGRRRHYSPEQRFDVFCINFWPSKKNLRVVYEIKVSRSDFLSELKNPRKRQQALAFSNEFWFATPVGLVNPEELPPEAGLIEVFSDRRTRVMVPAPYRASEEPTWQLLASIARRYMNERMSEEHQRQLEELREDKRRLEEEVKRLRRRLQPMPGGPAVP